MRAFAELSGNVRPRADCPAAERSWPTGASRNAGEIQDEPSLPDAIDRAVVVPIGKIVIEGLRCEPREYPPRSYSKLGFPTRDRFRSERFALAWSRRCFDARVGRVGRRAFGRSVARRIRSRSRARASSRLRS